MYIFMYIIYIMSITSLVGLTLVGIGRRPIKESFNPSSLRYAQDRLRPAPQGRRSSRLCFEEVPSPRGRGQE